MRWCCLLVGLLVVGCTSDYDGESFDQVVDPDDIELVSSLPDGARIIGVVSDEEVGDVEATGVLGRALACDVEHRLLRRMKRTAAWEGGEFLVDVVCDTFEEEYSDGDEHWVYCETYCDAEVARRWIHDR